MKVSDFKDVSAKEAKAGVKTLKGMRKLLSKPEAWVQEDLGGPNAGHYCLLGALQEVNGPGEILAYRILEYGVEGEPVAVENVDLEAIYDDGGGGDPIAEFNDASDTEHKDILKFLDKSISFAEKLLVSRTKAEVKAKGK